jgi:hypothetical protein
MTTLAKRTKRTLVVETGNDEAGSVPKDNSFVVVSENSKCKEQLQVVRELMEALIT